MATYRDVYDDGDYRRNVPRAKKTNALLVRRPLGKVKPTTYSLPADSYTYGKSDEFDDEGAAAVVGSWRQHKANPEGLPGRDFVRLNKQAALHGCTTSKNVSTFRRGNDIRLRQGPIPTRTASAPGGGFNRNAIFGRPSEPSSNINDLLNNSYQRNWILEQNTMKQSMVGRGSMKYATSSHTRASLGHTKVKAPPPKAMFKLAQFQDVPSRVRLPPGYGIYPGHTSLTLGGGSQGQLPVVGGGGQGQQMSAEQQAQWEAQARAQYEADAAAYEQAMQEQAQYGDFGGQGYDGEGYGEEVLA